ncbi:nucleoside-diphosphate kinase [Thiomicrospira sp. R3]|uniref:nucleoside-diphosphate kinase n=1 Tax=Thiomicrospira sp. R3 TaxID=3035472 RepID=UPI00259B378D|nr:nucleoside-diphosphate kinase [Thiomicrospira sp. R3]WFE69122.1 nucleoside-diphosphate kinase [Thiomicrospira sp. R3]
MPELTLSIIKPDAVKMNLIGEIVKRFEAKGLRPVAMKMIQMTEQQAAGFYAEHQGRNFYQSLVDFMTSGACVVQVLAGEDAIKLNRQIMGLTDPAKAEAGTIRADFAESTRLNCVHGSDSPESAKREIAFFFDKHEIFTQHS